jgi:hypothetical protein
MVDAQLWLLSFDQQALNARQTSASNQTRAILDVLLLTLWTLQASWQPITSIQAAHNTAPQVCHRILSSTQTVQRAQHLLQRVAAACACCSGWSACTGCAAAPLH